MQPDCSTSRLEHRHALGQKAADDARQDVAGTGSGKRRRTVVCNRRATIWLGHHAIGSLQNQDGARFRSGQPSFLKFRPRMRVLLQCTEQPGKLSLVRCQHDRAAGSLADCISQRVRFSGKARQCIRIQHHRRIPFERGAHLFAHSRANASTRTEDDGISPFVGKKFL